MVIGGEKEMKTNYNLMMEKEIENLKGRKAKLLLHSCCGPCSTSVIEKLRPFFDVTVFYYNPNVFPKEEYLRRKEEQIKYLDKIGLPYIVGKYDIKMFYSKTAGLEKEPEGGLRCLECFKVRLGKTAKKAIDKKMEYFTTTLTVSPHKNSENINTIGKEIEEEYKNKIKFLPSDFKKSGGFLKSLELSKEQDMYRQEYCGCIFSMKERENNAKK